MRQNDVRVSAAGVTATLAQHALRWQLLWHRGLRRLGWPGLLGLALLLLTLIMSSLAWQEERGLRMLEQARSSQLRSLESSNSRVPAPAFEPTPSLAAPLPTSQDIHSLIALIQRVAEQHQLQWLAADYRYKAATSESLARFEVRGTVRGAYKPLRLWLAQLKEDGPSMLLQEASINRSNADVADVDAKLVLVFALVEVPPGTPVATTPSSSLPVSQQAPRTEPIAVPSSGAAR
jgi:hypothetical protein